MTSTSNRLLATLPDEDRLLVEKRLERVELRQGDILFESNQPIPYVYFFEGGLSSEIATNDDANRIEVGCIGKEGLSGIPIALGADRSPHYAFVQVGGPAIRVSADALRSMMDVSKPLRDLLLRYAHVFMIQIAATALADGRYEVEPRLARWVLMCQDRLGDELPLTHDFLALMLGVRRPSVTDALHKLEGALAIRADRSLITVRDRSKLEDIAGRAYGQPEGNIAG